MALEEAPGFQVSQATVADDNQRRWFHQRTGCKVTKSWGDLLRKAETDTTTVLVARAYADGDPEDPEPGLLNNMEKLVSLEEWQTKVCPPLCVCDCRCALLCTLTYTSPTCLLTYLHALTLL